MLGGESLRNLPRTDRGTGHAVQQRLACHDEDPVAGREVLDDVERLDQHLVCREVRRHTVGGLDRLTEQREQLAVAAPPASLELPPRRQQARELVHEVVDRKWTAQGHLRDVEHAHIIAAR